MYKKIEKSQEIKKRTKWVSIGNANAEWEKNDMAVFLKYPPSEYHWLVFGGEKDV